MTITLLQEPTYRVTRVAADDEHAIAWIKGADEKEFVEQGADRYVWDLSEPTVRAAWVVRSHYGLHGYCYAWRDVQWPDASGRCWVFLSRCYVAPAARGNGLQQRMLRARERWAATIGAFGTFTYTVPSNWPSSNNLIRAGYTMFWPSAAYRAQWASSAGDHFLYWKKRVTT